MLPDLLPSFCPEFSWWTRAFINFILLCAFHTPSQGDGRKRWYVGNYNQSLMNMQQPVNDLLPDDLRESADFFFLPFLHNYGSLCKNMLPLMTSKPANLAVEVIVCAGSCRLRTQKQSWWCAFWFVLWYLIVKSSQMGGCEIVKSSAKPECSFKKKKNTLFSKGCHNDPGYIYNKIHWN